MNFHNELGQLQVSFIISQAALETDTWVFLADRNYVVTAVKEIHTVTNLQTLTFDLKVTRSGTVQAPTSGTTILSAAKTLVATANTLATVGLSTTNNALQINTGDLIGLDLSGTVDTIAGCLISITLEPR